MLCLSEPHIRLGISVCCSVLTGAVPPSASSARATVAVSERENDAVTSLRFGIRAAGWKMYPSFFGMAVPCNGTSSMLFLRRRSEIVCY
jgi:hypothetical protein